MEDKKSVKNKKKLLAVIIAVIVAAAVIVTVIVLASGKSGNAGTDDTGIDDTGVGELASDGKNDPENAGRDSDKQNGKIETDENGDPVESLNGGDNADPNDPDSPVSSDIKDSSDAFSDSKDSVVIPGISGYVPGPSIAPDDTDEADLDDPDDPELADPDDIDSNDPIESTVVVEAGKGSKDWPASIPSVIPVFGGDIVFSNNCTYEKYEIQEIWFMGWDGTVSAYNTWINDLANAGFKSVPDVYGYYVNGEYLLDITIEEEFNRDEDGEQIPTGNVWVSMDVYHAFDIVYPEEIKNVMPTFDLDATLDYWNVDKSKRSVSAFYQTAGEWTDDIATLKRALADAGFSVSDVSAVKKSGDVTVTVKWSASDTKIVITY